MFPPVFVVDLRAVVFRAVDFRAVVLRLAGVAFFAVDVADDDAPAVRRLAAAGFAFAVLLVDDDESSSDHLPDRTRCAASATASAISDPSRDALLKALLAAAWALSAASIPASLILRRADGLAVIAAAVAARPAASISRLIAAFAILSTVLSDPVLLPLEALVLVLLADVRVDPALFDDVFFGLAMLTLLRSRQKTLQERNGSTTSAKLQTPGT